MLVKWLIDGEGPSPMWDEDHRTVRIPAGTVMGVGAKIGDEDCWHLCTPDGSGNRHERRPGLIYCEPHDDEARAKVEEHYRSLSPDNRRWFDLARKRTDVVRKEQLAALAADEKAGIPPLPIHPDLLATPASVT